MNKKENIKSVAYQISDLLSEYVDLHDKILNKAGTFISLFKKIDFKGLYQECDILSSKFRTKEKELLSLDKNILNDNEIKYYNQLVKYLSELHQTVKLLAEKQYLLLKRSENEKIGWRKFSKVDKQYKNSIYNYLHEGEKLNSMKDLIFTNL